MLRGTTFFRAALFALLSSLLALPLSAAPPLIADFWKPAAYADPILSRDGKYFAVTVPINGRRNLVVIDFETRKAQVLTNYELFDVEGVHWVGNKWLVYSLGQLNTPVLDLSGGGLYAIRRDGLDSRKLAPSFGEIRSQMGKSRSVYQFRWRTKQFLASISGSDDEILVQSNERVQDAWDVYRVNLSTGRNELLTSTRPEKTYDWLIDRNDVPRVVTAGEAKSVTNIVYWRASVSAEWQELWRYRIDAAPTTVPLYFAEDNETLIVASNEGRDTMAIFKYDPRTRQRGEMLAQHPRYDMGANELGDDLPGLTIDPKSKRIVGFSAAGAKPETVWIDADYARLQKTLDGALPGTYNNFRRTPDGKRLLVASYSDREPARWYLFDEGRRTLEELFASRPWLSADALVEMRPVFYKTRDGQEFLAYVLLPKDRKPGERLPTVIHVHGGPHARADYWGYGSFGTREGQLLASRGYAVVVPNFRITPGFGAKAFFSGFRQMGKAMQEDIEDATDWAIREGIADPKRICLSGASYGGYATLMGLAKTPAKYRCGIAGLAVTDLPLQLTSTSGDTVYSERGLRFWKALAGDPTEDGDAMRAVSPAYLAERITAPVLMYSGEEDIRVPLEQPQAMRRALVALGRPPVWIVKAREGHGYSILDNNVELYGEILDFLAKHIGSLSSEQTPGGAEQARSTRP
jgi:dipeptidyl aminopeptidase/acylaminoacyl peptidase